MNRQRALRWAALLILVAMVSLAPLSAGFTAPVTAALAQNDAAVDAGEPADLAIAALNCAEAPASEALTAFFSTGTAPGGCSPAEGVTISVSEDGDPVPSSPSTTDVDGIVVLPVSLGSAIEVSEDPQSLPSGYEPLTQEANGVPYANPVQIDSAVAGAAVLFVNVPHAVATELAQDAPADAVGESTDLAVVALQCTAAPAAEPLTSFFSTGTPPSGCAPAVGVGVAVMENEQPLSGSPFTTDADGVLSVPVGLGAAVSVEQDPKTLPTGYEPLTQAANGVPYANPVNLDSVTAGTAVLFVNVPASVAATLTGDALAVGGGATNLAQSATPDRTGCDPAYPDARTCIAPGRPLAAPCSITDQRNFTVLAPDPRGLDADRDGIGCEPISPGGGTVARNASDNRSSSGSTIRRAEPAAAGGAPVAAGRVRSDAVARNAQPERSRAVSVLVQRDRGNAGLWSAVPSRTGTGNVAIVSNPVFIANGMWGWPNRFNRDDWIWRQRHPGHGDVGFLPGAFNVGNVTVTGSGSGNVAVVSNPVFISKGVWAWPDHGHSDDWRWRNRLDNGAWFWPNQFTSGNVTVASSGNGNIAIVSNPVFISSGVWHWPGHLNAGGWPWNHGPNTGQWRWPNYVGKGVWGRTGIISVGNLVIARSGNNVAIVSNPVVIIASGLWYVPPAHNHDDDWYDHHARDRDHDDRDHDRADAHLMQNGSAQADQAGVDAQAVDGGSASDAPPSEIELFAASTQPALTINGGLAVEPTPAGAMQPSGDAAVASPTEVDQAASDGDAALPSEGTIASPGDGTVATPLDAAAPSQPDAGAPAASDVAPEPGYVAPDPAYVDSDPAVDPAYVDPAPVDSGYVEQAPAAADAGADPGYVEPSYVEPSYVDTGNVDTGYVAPDPVIEPSYSEPQPSYVDPGADVAYVAPEPVYAEPDPVYVAPDPVYVAPEPNYVAPEPSYVDPGNGAANPGVDAGFGGQDLNSIAPAPNVANPGMDIGRVDAGNASAGTMAPDSGMNAQASGDPGSAGADFGGGGVEVTVAAMATAIVMAVGERDTVTVMTSSSGVPRIALPLPPSIWLR